MTKLLALSALAVALINVTGCTVETAEDADGSCDQNIVYQEKDIPFSFATNDDGCVNKFRVSTFQQGWFSDRSSYLVYEITQACINGGHVINYASVQPVNHWAFSGDETSVNSFVADGEYVVSMSAAASDGCNDQCKLFVASE